MGACCLALGDQGKCEDLIAAYEREAGLGSCDFPQAARNIDGYSNPTKMIEPVRIPILCHSLGIKAKPASLPGLPTVISFLDSGRGWSQKRLAMLCCLCYPGSNLAKAAYLMKVYSTDSSVIYLEAIQEMVSDAIHIAIELLPQAANEYYKARGRKDLEAYVMRLELGAEQAKIELLSRVGATKTPPQLTIDVFHMRMANGGLKGLCGAGLMRRLAHANNDAGGRGDQIKDKTTG